MQKEITRQMHGKGLEEQWTGTRLMREAVAYVVERPGLEQVYMTKELYPYLAKLAGRTPESVERAMRYAVHNACPGQTVGEVVYELAAKVRYYAG